MALKMICPVFASKRCHLVRFFCFFSRSILDIGHLSSRFHSQLDFWAEFARRVRKGDGIELFSKWGVHVRKEHTQHVQKEILQNSKSSIFYCYAGLSEGSFFMLRKKRLRKLPKDALWQLVITQSTHVSNHQCQPTVPKKVVPIPWCWTVWVAHCPLELTGNRYKSQFMRHQKTRMGGSLLRSFWIHKIDGFEKVSNS